MEENQNTVMAEETAPQGTEEMTSNAADEQAQGNENTTSDAVEQNAEQQSTDTDINPGASTDGAEDIPVQYNHETKFLSRADAARWAQKGMQADSLMEPLRYLAARAGANGVGQFIKDLISTQEGARMAELRRQMPEAEEAVLQAVFDAENGRFKSQAEAILQAETNEAADAEKSAAERIAAGFAVLQQEFPETIKTVQDIPDGVLRLSAKENIPLFDAYLRYQHNEGRKIEAATKQEQNNQAAGVGKVDTGSADASTPEIEAMRRGVRSI